MTKRNFIIGISGLNSHEIELLDLKFDNIFSFKKVDLKNLISSFINVDVFISNDKLTPTMKKFLRNINIPFYIYEEYQQNIERLVSLITSSIRNAVNNSKDYNDALILLNNAHEKGHLNYHELNHSIRVANESSYFGKKLGFQGDRLKKLYTAALLHDIGKSGIPKEILTKKGKLTDKEFDIIKAHPIIGGNVVKEDIKEIIRAHHERYDGSGYPSHLKGEEISLESRIISLVDSYDALTTKRSYKEKIGIEESLYELQRCSISLDRGGKGMLYDPLLVQKFINLKMIPRLNFT